MTRVSLVILTHERPRELYRVVARASALPERPPIIVVDNASRESATAEVRQAFPEVVVLRMPSNLGAAARNAGAELAQTPYVAFSDDDTEWEGGSLERAVEILDAYPRIAGVTGRVLVGCNGDVDPASRIMAESPLPSAGLPGRVVLGFLAGCVVFRRACFLEAGGYERRFFIGGEESLLALDLAVRGWSVIYSDALVTRHYPSPARDRAARKRALIRNALWVAWLRRPMTSAMRETARIVRQSGGDVAGVAGCLSALGGIAWVARNRRVVPPAVEALCARLDGFDRRRSRDAGTLRMRRP